MSVVVCGFHISTLSWLRGISYIRSWSGQCSFLPSRVPPILARLRFQSFIAQSLLISLFCLGFPLSGFSYSVCIFVQISFHHHFIIFTLSLSKSNDRKGVFAFRTFFDQNDLRISQFCYLDLPRTTRTRYCKIHRLANGRARCMKGGKKAAPVCTCAAPVSLR